MASRRLCDAHSHSDSSIVDSLDLYRGNWHLINPHPINPYHDIDPDAVDLDYDSDSYVADLYPLDSHSRNLEWIYARAFKSQWRALSSKEREELKAGYPVTLIPPDGKTINAYLPSELLRGMFIYSIESNNMKFGHLASVCRYWRSVVTAMPHLWSTLRLGTWTGTERVTNWLQRAYPKKVVIDTQRGGQMHSITPYAALQNALVSTGYWHELTISSLPPEDLAGQLGFRGAAPMGVLRSLHVVVECVESPSFTHLLDLVPTEAPLSELRLHSSFASVYFLQPKWFPVLRDLTVLIVNGRDINEPFEFLPSFTRLHTFEADRLPLPWYDSDTNLPLLCTLQKLQLRASSVQWMAGRQFSCLEECAILLPRDWEAVQQREVQLPSCKKLIYHGYPMTTVRYFRVPEVNAMELKSHDCKKQRVYQQLHNLCTTDGTMSQLATLHLTLQCSEQALIKVLRYLGLLQELVVSIARPSPSFQNLLQPLIAKPSREDWRDWSLVGGHQKWEQWCCSQTWCANVLPHLKYLGIQCPNGIPRSEYLDNGLLFRVLKWTRAHSIRPLEHLKVWEGSGASNVVDDVSTDYPEEYDSMILSGMVTQHLVIQSSTTALFQLHSTILFRQLQSLVVDWYHSRDHEIPILPDLEQIKTLEIWDGDIPTYSLKIDLQLVRTLQRLKLRGSSFSWMLGRTFKALREFQIDDLPDAPETQSGLEKLQVDMPACTILKLWNISSNHLHFLSCPNVQILQWEQSPELPAIDVAALRSPQIFLRTCSCLQRLDILIPHHLGRDPLIQFVFGEAMGQGVWRDIMSVEVKVSFKGSPSKDRQHFFSQMFGRQRDFDKLWKEFTVTDNDSGMMVTVKASM